MTKLIIISILLISSIAFSGEVYKWKDANGVTRFSNTAPPKDAQMIGKETNYVAPAPTPIPMLSEDERARNRERSEQLEIERQKTIQKTMDAQTAAANARAAAFESNAKTIESTGRQINGLLGVPYR